MVKKMTMDFSKMSNEELISLKKRLLKGISVNEMTDKKNPEALVDPGKGKVVTGSESSLDTNKPEGSQYTKVTKPPEEGKSMNINKEEQSAAQSGNGTEITPMSGKPVESKPSQVVGPKAEESTCPACGKAEGLCECKKEEHDLPPQARSAAPAGAGVEPPAPTTSVPVPHAVKLEEQKAKAKMKLPKFVEEFRAKQEEAVNARTKLEEECKRMTEELGAIQTALAGPDAKPQPGAVAGPAPDTDDVPPTSSEELASAPQYLEEDEEDDEARKSLKKKGIALFTALKSVQDALESADDMVGGVKPAPPGSQLPSHPQPSAKIPAQPGQSGSSGVYREEGGKPNLDLESPSVNSDESGGNKKKITDNAKGTDPKDVSGTYNKPTALVTGTGYTGKSAKKQTIQKISDLRPSYKELGRDRDMPMLKHMMTDRIPTAEEVANLAENGELMPELTKEYRASIMGTLGPENTLLKKSLKVALEK